MAAITENQIIDNAYYLTEKASELWETDSDEYLTARGFANAAINRWERYDQTKWKDLLTTLTDAADGDKTITAGDYSYDAPTNFMYPSSYVRTVNSAGYSTFWQVIVPEKQAMFANSSAKVCWFTGNEKTGYDLHFNPYQSPLTTGDTINYEYYKHATTLSSTTGTTEVPDPWFISYYIAAHMAEEGVDPDLNNMAEARLEQMHTQNMSQLFAVSDDIPDSLDNSGGFGY